MQATASVSAKTNPNDRRLLLVALALGAIAAGLILTYLTSLESRARETVPMGSVVVAKENIAAGTKIRESMLELKALPETAVIADAVTDKEKAVDQTLRYPVARGEQLTRSRFVDRSTGQALSFQIPAGLRGFTVPVNVNKSPAALLTPGDFVDVLASADPKSLGMSGSELPAGRNADRDSNVVMTVVQNRQVLSVGRQYLETGAYDETVRGAPPKDPNVSYVTLAVTPEEAQLLAWVVDKAKLVTFSLRAFGEANKTELAPLFEVRPDR